MKSTRIIMSATSDLASDQRITRIAGSLHAAGYDVTVIGRVIGRGEPLAVEPYKQIRLRPWFRKGKWFYLEFNIRLFFFLLFRPADILNANDLDTLPANFLVSRIRRKKIIYDSHEYFTEVPELIGRKFSRSVWLFLEKRMFPRIPVRYTVSSPIAEAYVKKYGGKVAVVRNLPILAGAQITGENPSHILIYQGSLNLGRGLELLISVMKILPEFKLLIAGKGDLEKELGRMAAGMENVTFTGRLRPEELAFQTASACIGFSIEEELGESYRFGLPNKLFDYIRSGLPVIVSELGEMVKVVNEYEIGEILLHPERSEINLAELIRGIAGNPVKWQKYRKNCIAASGELNWEKEEGKVLDLYRS